MAAGGSALELHFVEGGESFVLSYLELYFRSVQNRPVLRSLLLLLVSNKQTLRLRFAVAQRELCKGNEFYP